LKTRITFVGEDYWTAHLASAFNERFPEGVACVAIRLRGSRLAIGRAVWHLMRDDVIVRVGFPPPTLPEYEAVLYADRQGLREELKRALFLTAIGRALRRVVLFTRLDGSGRRRFVVDWAQRSSRWLRSTRSDFMYWIGSDVLYAADVVDNAPSGLRFLARFSPFRHVTGVHRLTEELEKLGVKAETVPYPGRIPQPPTQIAPMPERMTVLTYVPDARRDFYGLPALMRVAEVLADVDFLVMGGTDGGLADSPANMSFLGFVDDPRPLYDRSSVVIRHVSHDGAGYSMVEGLLHGRQVIYTYEVPHTIHVPFGDVEGLTEALGALREQHMSGGIPLNKAGREWALVEYDADRRFRSLLGVLLG